MTRTKSVTAAVRLLAAASLVAALSACASGRGGRVPPGTIEPDKFLFDRGTQALNSKKWLTAREFFKQVVDIYTQSPYRPDSKLGVADTYLGEGSSEALVLAIAEYKEFLSFYPTNPRADYAQLKLGVAHFRQMRAPQRDQTETQEAIKEFEIFISRYPKSAFMSECQGQLRIARNRLGDANYQVGYFYFRQRWYPGAVDRFKELLKNDPAYGGRDAVYFYLGESLLKEKRQVEALPYYERLVDEFHESEHLAAARKRISELKAAPPTAS